jgi:hypothetical protein
VTAQIANADVDAETTPFNSAEIPADLVIPLL